MADEHATARDGDTDREPWVRRAGDPPRTLFLTLLGVTTAATLCLATLPNGHVAWALAVAAAWLSLAASWVGMLVSALARSAGRARLRRHGRRWLVVPLTVTAVAAAVYADLPFRAGFAVSENALHDTAIAVSEGREPDLGMHGIYRVTGTERIPGGVLLTVAGGDGMFYIQGGLAYSPGGPPQTGDRWIYVDHVTGPWYVWYEKW